MAFVCMGVGRERVYIEKNHRISFIADGGWDWICDVGALTSGLTQKYR